jgi:hypothetical protein
VVDAPASGYNLMAGGGIRTFTVRFHPSSAGPEITDTLNLSIVDPLAPTTVFGTASVHLGGEGALPGARLLVTAGGAPAGTVRKIVLQRKSGGGWATVAQATNVPLTEITRSPCSPVRFHMEAPLGKVGRYRFVVTQGQITRRTELTFSQGQFVEVVATF